MRRLLLVAVVLVSSVFLNSQEHPKYELFAGYSLQHDHGFNASGWEASGAYNFNRWIGMKLDADGHYGTFSGPSFSDSTQWHTVTLGPQFSWRLKRGTLFAHTLFGFAREHEREHITIPFPFGPFTFDGSSNSFATILGGGGDWNLGSRFAWRAQVDYTQNSLFGRHENHVRFSTGPVFRFGK
jgi:hypothetical protein